MSPTKLIDNPDEKVQEVVEMVCHQNEPVTIRTKGGDEVRVIPVPKPIGHRKGIPIYREEDIQYLSLDHPYWFE